MARYIKHGKTYIKLSDDDEIVSDKSDKIVDILAYALAYLTIAGLVYGAYWVLTSVF